LPVNLGQPEIRIAADEVTRAFDRRQLCGIADDQDRGLERQQVERHLLVDHACFVAVLNLATRARNGTPLPFAMYGDSRVTQRESVDEMLKHDAVIAMTIRSTVPAALSSFSSKPTHCCRRYWQCSLLHGGRHGIANGSFLGAALTHQNSICGL
jgi:hypothetical protein